MKKDNKNRINYLKEPEQEKQFNQSINTITKEDVEKALKILTKYKEGKTGTSTDIDGKLEWLRQLLEIQKENPNRIIRPAYEDSEGSPVLFPSWAFPELKALPEGKGGGIVIKNHPQEVYRVSVSNPFELADADTPETLELLKGLCHD